MDEAPPFERGGAAGLAGQGAPPPGEAPSLPPAAGPPEEPEVGEALPKEAAGEPAPLSDVPPATTEADAPGTPAEGGAPPEEAQAPSPTMPDEDIDDMLSEYAPEEELLMDTNVGIELSGWIDVVAKHDTREDSKPYFDVQHIYLIADARVGDVWRAFFETEYEHLPVVEAPSFDADAQEFEGTRGEIKLERAYIEGGFHRGFGMRLGKFNTPMGLRIPAHWLIITPIVQKPIHEDNAYAPLKSVGIDFFGWLPLGEQELGYSAYVSNGSELFGTDEPEDGITGAGGDLNLRLFGWALFGGSYHHQKNPSHGGRTEHNAAAYAEVDLPLVNLLLRGEYFVQHRESDPDDAKDVRTIYGLARYTLHFWEPLSLAYRFDWGDDERRAGGARHLVHNLNLSVQPEPFLRFSLEGNLHRFPNGGASSYEGATVWAGMAF